MSRARNISMRVGEEVDLAIAKAARDNQRSKGSMMAFLVTSWLREEGYLPKIRSSRVDQDIRQEAASHAEGN